MGSADMLFNDLLSRAERVNVTFLSKTGNGKSACANTLLQAAGFEAGWWGPFAVRRQRDAVTEQQLSVQYRHATGVTLCVTDRPGLADGRGPDTDEQDSTAFVGARQFARIEPMLRGVTVSTNEKDGDHVLFVVQKITDRLDALEQGILGALARLKASSHVVLVLTHADVLDTEEEIARLLREAKADAERAIRHPLTHVIAVNNHKSNVAANGATRATSGVAMLRAIRDVVAAAHPVRPDAPKAPPRSFIEKLKAAARL